MVSFEVKEKDILLEYLLDVQFDFKPPLFQRINQISDVDSIEDYVDKLLNKANVFAICSGETSHKIHGIIAIYTNDIINLKAYIPILSVKKEMSGKGLAKELIEKAIDFAIESGMHSIDVKTWPRNEVAVILYKKYGFVQTKNDASNIYFTKQII